MVPVALSDVIAVGEVPTAEEIDILAKAGFRSVLLTQPENEVARLLTKDEVAARAAGAGLAFAYIPVESRRPPESSVSAFIDATSTLPRPIYACCYSGARTSAIWALAASRTMPVEKVMEACAAAGYDVSFLKPEIEARKAAAEHAASVAAAQAASAAVPTAIGNGSGDGKGTAAAGVAPPVQTQAVQTQAVPALTPIVLPRAATAGGFAVAG